MTNSSLFEHDAYLKEIFVDLAAEEVDIDDVEFEDCRFTGCRFRASTFRSCRFIDCVFQTSDLSLIKVPSSRFTDTKFLDCKLIGVEWTDSSSITGLATTMSFLRCDVSYSFFVNLDLKGMQFLECTAHDVDFTDACLLRASFANCDLEGTRFFNTDLREANFVSATNYDIDPTHNKVKKARFSLPEAVGLLKSFGVVVQPW